MVSGKGEIPKGISDWANDFPTEGEYYCKVTDKLSGFSKHSDTTYVYVNERPRVQVYEPAGDTLICYGDTIYLMSRLNPALTRLSASDVNYVWTPDNNRSRQIDIRSINLNSQCVTGFTPLIIRFNDIFRFYGRCNQR